MPSQRQLGRLRSFFRHLLWSVPVATLLWWLALGFYTPALCWFTQGLTRLTEAPPAAQITPDGHRAILGRTDLRVGSSRLRVSLIQIHSNIVPFLALAFALPGRKNRAWWKSVGLALAILFGSHVLALMLQLKHFYAFSLGPWSLANYTDTQRSLFGGLRFFFDLPVTYALPMLLWVTVFADRVAELVGIGSGTNIE